MPICKACGNRFPCRVTVNGIVVLNGHRAYCHTCNPIGERRFWRGEPVENVGKGKRVRRIRTFVCKACGKERTQQASNNECSTCSGKRIQNRKKRELVGLLGGRCRLCGYNRSIAALSFHHLDPSTKLFTISMNMARPMELLEAEARKCMLLCMNCHVEKHAFVEN